MIRVLDLDAALDFFVSKLGLIEVRRKDSEKGRFTLVFLASPEDPEGLMLELTHNWVKKTHTASVETLDMSPTLSMISTRCARSWRLRATILRPPRDGRMAFIRSQTIFRETCNAEKPPTARARYLAPVRKW